MKVLMMRRTAALVVFMLCWSAGVSSGADRNWTGGVGDWNDAGNWDPPGIPQTGEHVLIETGSPRLGLDAPTPRFSGLTVTGAGMLVLSNWNTAVNADTVTIGPGGTVTLPTAFTNDSPSNRVYFTCGDFLLDTGGTIDVRGRGFRGGIAPIGDGQGEGGGIGNDRSGGGGHGGRGGWGEWANKTNSGGRAYGSLSAPEAPGSGGGYGVAVTPGNGGGAVRIAATGTVTLRGRILADGSDAGTTHSLSGGGSGGSIFITADRFTGAGGLLSANGGRAAWHPNGFTQSGSGGGGRIAVVCEGVDAPYSVGFSAATGINGRWGRTWSDNHDPGDPGKYQPGNLQILRGALPGTVYLSIPDLLPEVPATLSGFFYIGSLPATTVTLDRDITVTNGVLGIPEGANWTVNGSLTVSGAMAGLYVGGSKSDPADMSLGASSRTVFQAGNLTLEQGATLYAWAAGTNVVAEDGAWIGVTGLMTLARNAWCHPGSHPINGGHVRFELNDLDVDSTSGFRADHRGFGGVRWSKGLGGGGGGAGDRGGGGGHGGKGGVSSSGAAGGIAYGNTNMPMDPGSSAGVRTVGADGSTGGYGSGGGVIRIHAAGHVALDGTLSADGMTSSTFDAGGGAGGSILLDCASYQGGKTSTVRARGGSSPASGVSQGGGGGGGRVAIWVGLPAPARAALLAGNWPVAGVYAYDDLIPWHGGTGSVASGTGKYAPPDAQAADPGTLVSLIVKPSIRKLYIEGEPDRHGDPMPQFYGLGVYDPDEVVTNSVATPTAGVNGLRRACIGWRLETWNGEALLDSGTTSMVELGMSDDRLLTWRWTNEWLLAVSTGDNGAVNDVVVNGWYREGVRVAHITATPVPGYVFSQWLGADVPDGMALANPLAVTMNQARTNIMAVFVPNSGTAKSWTAADGDWSDASKWNPPGVPGILDPVIIVSGTCRLTDSRVAAEFSIKDGATLVFTNWHAALSVVEGITIESNAVVTLPPAFTNASLANRVFFVCRTFDLQDGALIDATGKGFRGPLSGNWFTPGSGPGGGGAHPSNGRAGGGGHGGRGGLGESGVAGGVVYDDEYAPVMPGSSGGLGNVGNAGHGGGAVRIEASLRATINGAIRADGTSASAGQGGGGAGGSIDIKARQFAGGTNAILSAIGGNCPVSGIPPDPPAWGSGGGGGGRIAVWVGVAEEVRQRYLASGDARRLIIAETHDDAYHGQLAVEPGTGYRDLPDPMGADPGTVRFITSSYTSGMLLILQ